MTENDNWKELESIWEKRRKAPFHFYAKASNARMSAYILSHIRENSYGDLASEAGYGGDPAYALYESFLREASISLELISKAILCLKKNEAPRFTHDVYELWSEADLPKLSEEDSYRLAYMTQVLYWSGRYAAPKADRDLSGSYGRLEKHQKAEQLGKYKVHRTPMLGWKEFDLIYQIAHQNFWDLDPQNPKNFMT